MKPLAMMNGEFHICRMSHTAAEWRFNCHRANAAFIVEAVNSHEDLTAERDRLREENERFRVGIKRLSDEEEKLAETTDGEEFSLVSLSAQLAHSEGENRRLREENAHLSKRNLEVQMLAWKWQEAHDLLKSGKPYGFPSPSDLPASLEKLTEAERVIDLMADVVTYDATMQGPKVMGVNGSAARRAAEAARKYLIDRSAKP
jgi:predicted nuclease with TOPRIM domain